MEEVVEVVAVEVAEEAVVVAVEAVEEVVGVEVPRLVPRLLSLPIVMKESLLPSPRMRN